MDPRYSRQLALPGFGADAQERLATARVLVVGAGGLGSSVLPALAGAGVGTDGQLTTIDDDRVELSNLHRQTIHTMDAVGSPKVNSAADSMAAINPDVTVHVINDRLTTDNARQLIRDHDLVIDGSDNFPTRYLVADAAALEQKPVVWGAVSQYGGQASVTVPGGPGYRDLFPSPPPAGSVLSCEDGGVLPTTVAVIGSIMATETLKLLTGIGRPLVGRVTTYDALSGAFRELSFEHDPDAEPITTLIDYELFCGVAPSGGRAGAGAAGGTTVTAAELAAELNRNEQLALIDVREPWEAELASIDGARLIPLGELPAIVSELDSTARYVVYCHHGIRSLSGLQMLLSAGLDARHLEGGIEAWATTVDPDMARY
jgi:sulfur-carrier protein adenylyltransferase/sulfurtransferase